MAILKVEHSLFFLSKKKEGTKWELFLFLKNTLARHIQIYISVGRVFAGWSNASREKESTREPLSGVGSAKG